MQTNQEEQTEYNQIQQQIGILDTQIDVKINENQAEIKKCRTVWEESLQKSDAFLVKCCYGLLRATWVGGIGIFVYKLLKKPGKVS